ncbi:MAG: PEGA domain-containing protein [Planctomycetota bacterium]|jgi:hypothetical protein|nr:PEGA domain-containing protein [Planctomycetota bacterium]
MRITAVMLAVAILSCLPGCVERALVITSDPSGADVTVNQQWKGKTPYIVPFKHYGVYDIWIEHPGFEENGVTVKFYPLHVGEPVQAPRYQYAGADFVSEALLPATLRDQHNLHYVLERVDRADEVGDILVRAGQLRDASQARNRMRRDQDASGRRPRTEIPDGRTAQSGGDYPGDVRIDATPPSPMEVPLYQP